MKRKFFFFVLEDIASIAMVLVLWSMGYGMGDWQWWGICVLSAAQIAFREHAHKTVENPRTMTNFDKLRAMSDEELAVFLERSTGGCETCAVDCVCNGPEDLPAKEVCHQGVLVWLRQPAKEDDHEKYPD